jgi:CRP-like cAMP-binding protein
VSAPDRNKPAAKFPLFQFSAFADLSIEEAEALGDLEGRAATYKRGEVLRREGDPNPGLYLLHRGWAATYRTLPTGGRQYFNIHCSGDLMGAPSLPLQQAAETLFALTDATISAVSADCLSALFVGYPRLAVIFFLKAQVERAYLMDHVAALGRCNAEQRIAGFLVHVGAKASLAAPHPGPAFELPLTQKQIGDVLGLTPVHVNRVLRSFDQSGHIRRYRRWIELLRADDLRTISGLAPHAVVKNADWLPPI